MEIYTRSFFKSPDEDKAWFDNWVKERERLNNRLYEKIEINTGLGKTVVWSLNSKETQLETLVIFPGARTSSLFWDFDKGLDNLGLKVRIFMVETNGLPNPSDGNAPEIKSTGYGEWASQVLDQLGIDQPFVAGASFGGLICMKLAIVNPAKIKAIFLLNPGCLQPFSLSPRNLYFNLLPILFPNKKNVRRFLDAAVFSKPHHQLSQESERSIIDYEVFALKHYKDRTEKPYYMGDELRKVKTDTYLLEGDKDLLFPFRKSIENAKAKISNLKDVRVFENVGHGIETFPETMRYIGHIIKPL